MAVSRQIEQAVFEAASSIDSEEVRNEFLDRVCGDDSAQRTRIGTLLEANEDADDFFREAAGARTMVAADACRDLPEANGAESETDGETEGPGTWIGRYCIEKRIGEGGCGVVYLAEQREPVRRKVALKVIRLGMDTERVIARFEIERQSLAVMDHPNIAKVLDAGTTGNGRPYFVMGWVQGERITDYCDHHRLTIGQRIELFTQVCQAIQHAHQKGVIHRDIKPSNILITEHNGRPSPKVIDFGIAKATEGGSEMDTRYTSAEPFIGTPAYMSPEQADRRSVDIDTRSDVYSLGILLYELLTGRTPFDPEELAEAGVTEMRRILMDRSVPPPSDMLASLPRKDLQDFTTRCRLEGTKLIHLLAGDLDWVVMKAIEKDRSRRYETVNGLAMDLRRYLENEPVVARPPSRFYLFRKFVRRNRVACLASVATVGSLALGFGFASRSYLRERMAREEQARLRNIAETALANEARLRELSMVRENMAQVAVLVSEGRTEEADALLRHHPLSTIEPSLEAANVLRSLGGWNAMRGRWHQAAECYLLLTQANRLLQPDDIVENVDLMSSGAALAEAGDMEDYNRFREWVVSSFEKTDRSLTAQRAMQASLLLPSDQRFTVRLEHARDVLEGGQFDKHRLRAGWNIESAGWNAWSLALFHYRCGDFPEAVVWCELAEDLRIPKPAFSASLLPLLAMTRHQAGDPAAARRDLRRAREIIAGAFDPELVPAYEPLGEGNGYWWDWVQARILLREAEQLLRQPRDAD